MKNCGFWSILHRLSLDFLASCQWVFESLAWNNVCLHFSTTLLLLKQRRSHLSAGASNPIMSTDATLYPSRGNLAERPEDTASSCALIVLSDWLTNQDQFPPKLCSHSRKHLDPSWKQRLAGEQMLNFSNFVAEGQLYSAAVENLEISRWPAPKSHL